MEIIKVPGGEPRTKPKALAYALTLSSGKIVSPSTMRQDQPHPDQLHEAWLRFRDADEELGCIQAPLMVIPAQKKLLPILFGFEYAALSAACCPG